MKKLYNLYIYILHNVFLRKTMKFSSLPLMSPMCENVLNHLYHVFSTWHVHGAVHIPVGGAR